ncbi:hypothetical protein CAP35_05640 [Chitinophagaceae bacterium IBVUCB1]|nr:hypothetical protein CAP35_05640 [Chitinophagaceae bacterium IBVUCB1]
MKQLREPDIWWQLLAGRWMIDNGAVTHTDVFSYTMQGAKWINVKWLYEVCIAFFEKGLGPEAVILLQSLVNVAIVYLLYRIIVCIAKQTGKQPSVFTIAISLLVFLAICEYRMAGRPEMISHLLAAAYIYILWRRPQLSWKAIIWLVTLQCVWANMHEGYPVGIVIIGTMFSGSILSFFITKEKAVLQQAMRIGAVLVLAVLAILCNPNGIVLWQQPFEIYRQVWANKYTTELYAYTDVQYWTLQAKWHIIVLVLVTIYWVIEIQKAVKHKTIHQLFTPALTTHLLLIPLTAYLSLTANRNIPFAQILLIPSLPFAMMALANISMIRANKLFKSISAKAGIIAIVVGISFYVSIVGNAFYKYTNSPNKYGMQTNILKNPTGAVDFIRQHNIKGRAFSDYFVSSYLLWSMYPDFKSYIDLRDLDVFPVKFFDEYFSLYQQPEKFKQLDAKYNFNYVVLNASQLAGIQFDLYWNQGYNLVYVDPVSVIFLKQNEQNKPINSNTAIQKLFSWPAIPDNSAWASGLTRIFNPLYHNDEEDEEALQHVYASRFYNQIQNYKLSLQVLKNAPTDNVKSLVALGNTYLQYAGAVSNPTEKKSKVDSAEIYLTQALETDNDEKTVYSNLGSLYALKGDYESAASYISTYLQMDKTGDYMYYLYGYCNRALWKKGDADKLDEVIPAMQASLRLNPQNGKAHLYMAEAFMAQNDNDEARKQLKLAIQSGNPWLPDEQQLVDKLKQQFGVQ